MEEWFIYGIISALTAALATIFAKIGLQRVDPLLATTIRSIIMTILVIMSLSVFKGYSGISDLSRNEILYIVLSGLSGGASWILYFIALQKGEASKVALVDRSSVLFVLILSFIILHESITIKKLVAAGLIITALFLLLGA
ncbi:MAG: EamA family transporter [Desulfurococcaceae archaeon]